MPGPSPLEIQKQQASVPAEWTQPAGGYPASAYGVQESSLWQYWRILVKHNRMILACCVATTVLAILITLRTTPVYEAKADIAINRQSDVLETTATRSPDYYSDTTELDTQVKILQSDTMAMKVIRRAGLSGAPKSEGGLRTVQDAQSDLRELNRFKANFRAVVLPRTRIIELTFNGTDPKRASDVVNATIETFIDESIRSRFEATTQASNWLTRQLSELQIKVETSQQKLIDYQKVHNLVGIDDKQNITTVKLDELNKNLTDAESERIRAEAAYRISQGSDLEGLNPTKDSNILEKLRGQKLDLQTQYAQLRTTYGPSYPKVLEIGNQIKQLDLSLQAEKEKIVLRLKSDYDIALQRERLVRRQLELAKGEASKLGEEAIDYNLLKRDADNNRQLYDGLLKKLKEAELASGLNSSNIRVVDYARVPASPIKPNPPMNIAMGLFLGLLGGIGLAYVREAMDRTVRDSAEIEQLTAVPTLGFVPQSTSSLEDGKAGSKRRKLAAASGSIATQLDLVTKTSPSSQPAEAYRAIRTSLLLTGRGKPPKVILVTSSMPQEGKTTTALNTAVVLAQNSSRVLIIDADLRRPRIHRYVADRVGVVHGLSEIIAGTTTFEQVVTPMPGIANLDMLPAGAIPPQPAELLASSQMAELIERLRGMYDHIVVDSPPVLSVTDAVILSVLADSVAVVIRSGRATKQSVMHAVEMLRRANANVSGFILNAVDLGSADYRYGSYYYYGYGDYSSSRGSTSAKES